MAEITISLGDFKRLAAKYTAQVYESSDAVVFAFGSHLLRAYKPRGKRLFRRSIPMTAIGYSGIASWKMTPLRRRNGQLKRTTRT